MFFFEKKNQKTFMSALWREPSVGYAAAKARLSAYPPQEMGFA